MKAFNFLIVFITLAKLIQETDLANCIASNCSICLSGSCNISYLILSNNLPKL